MSAENSGLLRTRIAYGSIILGTALIGGVAGAGGEKAEYDHRADRIASCIELDPGAQTVDHLTQLCLAATTDIEGVRGHAVPEQLPLGAPISRLTALGRDYRESRTVDPGIELGLYVGLAMGVGGVIGWRTFKRRRDTSDSDTDQNIEPAQQLHGNGATAYSLAQQRR